MRTRAFLAALGLTFSLFLSVAAAVPAIYTALARLQLPRDYTFLTPVLMQAAMIVFFVCLWRDRGVARAAKAAAVCVVLQLAAEVIPNFRPGEQARLLWWLFGDVLGDFGWIVLLVLYIREAKPLEHAETRYFALLVALTIIVNTLIYLYVLTGSWRTASSEFYWALPESAAWRTGSVVISVCIHAGSAAGIVVFLLNLFHGGQAVPLSNNPRSVDAP